VFQEEFYGRKIIFLDFFWESFIEVEILGKFKLKNGLFDGAIFIACTGDSTQQ
jgi:hypothetical protein